MRISDVLQHLQTSDAVALRALKLVRSTFDLATGYGPNMNEANYLVRIIFLETVAGKARVCFRFCRVLCSGTLADGRKPLATISQSIDAYGVFCLQVFLEWLAAWFDT
jgi:hypothetical protein